MKTQCPARMWGLVVHYLRDGDKEKALQWLAKAYEVRSSWIATITYDPGLDSLRFDSRFQELIKRRGGPSSTPAP